MKEIRDILIAFETALKAGLKTALATVVHVEGSSYRRPGARMLVTEEGELTGAISGGCLEGDALRKALLAISEGKNKLVTYDTTDEDDAKLGVQLGCNGIVHILFEPVDPSNPNSPVNLLKAVAAKREYAILVTLFSLEKKYQPGTCLLYRGEVLFNQVPAMLSSEIHAAVQTVENKRNSVIQLLENDEMSLHAFVEYINPAVMVVVAGAGNDVMPLVEINFLLGWETIIVDGRASLANPSRFPKAKEVIVCKPAEVLKKIQPDLQTVFVLMTHNYNYDIALLKELLLLQQEYIGLLGPKKKLQRMMDEIEESGIEISPSQLQMLHGPVGLDIGAETAAEIALSIAAEIKAVLSNRSGTPLRLLDEPIHQRISQP